jgi:thiol:disulfide interchange protein
MKKCIALLIAGFFILACQSLFAQQNQWQFKAVKSADGVQLQISATLPKDTVVYAFGNTEGLPATTIEWDSAIARQITISNIAELASQQKKEPLLDNVTVFFHTGSFAATVGVKVNGDIPYLKGVLNYMGFDGKEFVGPIAVPFYLKKEADGSFAGGELVLKENGQMLQLSTVDLKNPVSACGIAPVAEKASGWKNFLLGLIGGLLALITPCVFPMIPLTVSFFTKKATDKSKGAGKATLYGFFIFLIYISLSIPFHIAGNADTQIYNAISTNVVLNMVFFAIFVVFAISFFGYFEITLPSGLANKTDAKRGTNLLGIFFMALTLAIVSFSCTGPIIGTLLAGTAADGPWPLTAGLAGFGLALGLPFALFALFPGWLSSLPRSGGWLDTVKVVLGFVELALAFKFFSNADLTGHWGILKREIFIGIWVLLALACFAYLMGWFSFKKQYVKPKVGGIRIAIAVVFLLVAAYLAPGITNTASARLSLVSGFPPPACYSIYKHPVNCDEPIDDFFKAVQLAKEKNKPLLIDFTGWACVNCRKMEENVWVKQSVKTEMEKFVLVSLYVDDKKELPVEEQFLFKGRDGSTKKIVTIGDKWSSFQAANFGAVSQPWYVLLSPDGRLLAPPVGYTPNETEYARWLQCGYDAFKKGK